MLTNKDKQFLQLIMRSPDVGDGWRSVSQTCWPLIVHFGQLELIEIDEQNRRVRLSPDGEVVVKFAL